VFADLIGKGGHVMNRSSSGLGRVSHSGVVGSRTRGCRTDHSCNHKAGRIAYGFNPKVIWSVVTTACGRCGLAGVAPHDLRYASARLCHDAGGEIEQIQSLLSPRKRSNHGAIHRLQAAAPKRGQRSHRAGAGGQ
jgi:hypothetical protein